MIKVQNLTKEYKVYKRNKSLLKDLFNREFELKKAVNDVSFNINDGEFVGFIGPNGAGKTTTLKMLSGLLYPSHGTVEVLGFTPFDRKKEFLRKISLVMGNRNQLMEELPPIDTFNLRRTIFQIPKDKYNKTLDELVELMGIQDVINIQVKKLSLGQKMKCEIALALLHSPKILFLDEPTIGLDILIQQKIREFLKEYNRIHKATILLTSHYMDDVSSLCDRIIVIKEGTKVYDGELQTFIKTKAKDKIVEFTYEGLVENSKLCEYGEVINNANNLAKLFIPREDVTSRLNKILNDIKVLDIKVEEPNLEDLIKEIF